MARITYAPAAVDDLCNIVSFIAQDNPDAAHNWLQRIAEVCELLAENPMIGEERRDFSVLGCRCFTVGNYVVFFRPVNDGVEVARIVHGRRDLRDI